MSRSKGSTGFAPELPGEEPSPIKQGDGLYYAERSRPVYVLALDAGSFEHVWRTVEAQYKTAHQHRLPAYEDLMRRIVLSFRECREQAEGAADVALQSPVAKARRVVRRPKKKASSKK